MSADPAAGTRRLAARMDVSYNCLSHRRLYACTKKHVFLWVSSTVSQFYLTRLKRIKENMYLFTHSFFKLSICGQNHPCLSTHILPAGHCYAHCEAESL